MTPRRRTRPPIRTSRSRRPRPWSATTAASRRWGAVAVQGNQAIVVAQFADMDSAKAAYYALLDAEVKRAVDIDGVLVANADGQGKIHIQKMTDYKTRNGFLWGAVGGAVIGLIFPPTILAGAVAVGIAGVAVGKAGNVLRRATWPTSSPQSSPRAPRASWRSCRHGGRRRRGDDPGRQGGQVRSGQRRGRRCGQAGREGRRRDNQLSRPAPGKLTSRRRASERTAPSEPSSLFRSRTHRKTRRRWAPRKVHLSVTPSWTGSAQTVTERKALSRLGMAEEE